MNDEHHPNRGPLEAALDLVFFGPLGLLTNCRELLPELAAKGREFVDQRLSTARVVGQFAVGQGQQMAADAAQRLVAREPGEPSAPPAATVDTPAAGKAPEGDAADHEHVPVRLEDIAEEGLDTVTWESVGADELAIPSYDSLAASQVVARLDGLDADELEAVRRYEVAHRHRKSVIGKITQLQQ